MSHGQIRFEAESSSDVRTVRLLRVARVAAAVFIVAGVASIALLGHPDVIQQSLTSPEEAMPAVDPGGATGTVRGTSAPAPRATGDSSERWTPDINDLQNMPHG